MKKLCIYHSNCADGFTSAWVVYKRYGLENVEFHQGVYNQTPPDVTDRDVIFVDFSYKRSIMEQLLKQAKSITILDHHKTAITDLEGLEGLNAVFDITRSGARITWDYYFDDMMPPELLLHIEDRDLWKFNMPRTREIQAAVSSYPYTFENWDDMMYGNLNKLYQEGVAIQRRYFKEINELLGVCQRRMTIGGYDVPVANLPYTMSSDAGHIMAQNEPFAACYQDTLNGRIFSLRSAENGLDVSEIAKKYGGGGHKHAAGFPAIIGWEGDDIQLGLHRHLSSYKEESISEKILKANDKCNN